MRVAVLGGGFFGCWLACKLCDINSISRVDLYEKSNSLMMGASKNNQHRFHLGYHYPRSPETVSQILKAKESFEEEFLDCTFSINENLYLVSKYDSLTSAARFSEVFSSHIIEEVDLRRYETSLHVDRLESGFIVQEKCLNNTLIRKKIQEELSKKRKLRINFETDISSLEEIDFDLLVNCTYTGTNITSSLKVKYELCSLALVRDPIRSRAYTVVDGSFPSLYPTETDGISTLSHVGKTPLYKTTSLEELFKFKNELSAVDLRKSNQEILEAASYFFKEKYEAVGQYLSYKVKLLEDVNDARTSEVVYENNKITLLQGKITTLSSVAKEVAVYAESYANR